MDKLQPSGIAETINTILSDVRKARIVGQVPLVLNPNPVPVHFFVPKSKGPQRSSLRVQAQGPWNIQQPTPTPRRGLKGDIICRVLAVEPRS